MSYQPDPYTNNSFQDNPRKPVHPLDQPPPQPPSPPPKGPLPPAQPRPRIEVPSSPPVMTYVILGILIVVFLVDYLSGGQLTRVGVKDNTALLAGQYWRLITPIFLHANIVHIGLNGYFLYLIGPQVERAFGTPRFTAIFMLSGIAGVLASFAFSSYDSLGASGALFGLIGALIPFLYRNRKIMTNTQRYMRNIILVIVVNLLIDVVPGLNIDYWAHLGGLAAGLLLAWFITPLYAVTTATFELVRIEDRTPQSLTWTAVTVMTGVLAGVFLLLLQIKG